MAINFPTSLDNFTNPTASDTLDSVTVPHATQHANINDAVEALEAKVGINGSAVTSSHDYKIAQLEAAVVTNGNSHDHSGGDGAQIAYSSLSGKPVAGTDFAPATSGSGMLKGNGSGGFSTATDGTDYLSSTTGIKQGIHTIWIPAGAMTARTTNGAAAGTVETTTNKVMLSTLDFDAATIEYAQFAIQMPDSWDKSTITAQFVWKHAATTTNFGVSWGIQGVAISNDDTADVAYGTAIYANDTGGTTNDIYVSPETAAVTIAGTPAAGDWVSFQVLRKADDGTNDTMAIDAGLLGVSIFYNVNAATD